MLNDVRRWVMLTMALGLFAPACVDDPGMAGSASVDEIFVEIDLTTHETRVTPEDMDRLVGNGGDGPVRLQIRDVSGEIVVEVRAKNLEEAQATLAQQAGFVAERVQANWASMVESMSSEDLDELVEMVMKKPASSWTQEELREFTVLLKEKSR